MKSFSWLKRLSDRFTGRGPRRPMRHPSRLRLELLEDRTAPATFAVTTTGDNLGVNPPPFAGTGTLRQALVDANATAGLDTIAFAIGTGPQTIHPLSALPAITDPVMLDATTQPGFAGAPLIELAGSGAGGGVNGLTITAGNSTVRGLVINRFRANGIVITGAAATGNSVSGNYIGLDVSGRVALGNVGDGVIIEKSASNNRVGTNGDGLHDEAERNVISASRRGQGVHVRHLGTSGNVIAGNYIGTDAAGSAAAGYGNGAELPWPAGGWGVLIIGGASNNRVGTNGDGTADATERNILSGNSVNGVMIIGAGTSGNVVAGNYIGTAADGRTALPNGGSGLCIWGGASNNRVGTDGNGTADDAERNVISGNAFSQIALADAVSNVIAGNYIGPDATGRVALANGSEGEGVAIGSGSRNNRVGAGGGPNSAAERNVISGNSRVGVSIGRLMTGPGVSGTIPVGNMVAGNFIGTDVTGFAPMPNGRDGILIANGAANTITLNLIAYNVSDGIHLSNTTDNSVRFNLIHSNRRDGISLVNADNNVIAGNVSDFNGRDGIRVDALSSGNTLEDNFLSFNGEHDAHDDSVGTGTAGTANLWRRNRGQTQNRPGLL